jgi:hypothetical protein
MNYWLLNVNLLKRKKKKKNNLFSRGKEKEVNKLSVKIFSKNYNTRFKELKRRKSTIKRKQEIFGRYCMLLK